MIVTMDCIQGWNRFGNERNNDENYEQRTGGESNGHRTENFADRQRGKFWCHRNVHSRNEFSLKLVVVFAMMKRIVDNDEEDSIITVVVVVVSFILENLHVSCMDLSS